MSIKIINYLTKFISGCKDEEFISLWETEEKDNVLELIKSLDKKASLKKKKKDKNAPKKNVSTWILFSKAERPKVKNEFPDMPPKEVMTELAKRWKIAKEDEEVLQEFKILAEDDKKRYEEEKKNYIIPQDDEEDDNNDNKKKKVKKQKKVKIPGQPSKPKSAWLIFCEEERKKLKDEEDTPKGKDILTELGARWKNLKEKGGKKYTKFETMAINDKERYNEQMKNFNKEVQVNEAEDQVNEVQDEVQDEDRVNEVEDQVEDELHLNEVEDQVHLNEVELEEDNKPLPRKKGKKVKKMNK